MRAPLTPNGETIWRQSGDDSRSSRENEAAGIITGARIDVSPKQLGYDEAALSALY